MEVMPLDKQIHYFDVFLAHQQSESGRRYNRGAGLRQHLDAAHVVEREAAVARASRMGHVPGASLEIGGSAAAAAETEAAAAEEAAADEAAAEAAAAWHAKMAQAAETSGVAFRRSAGSAGETRLAPARGMSFAQNKELALEEPGSKG